MYNNDASKKLFDSLMSSLNQYNNQLSEIGKKNMQHFANLFSGFKAPDAKDMFNFNQDAQKAFSAEQIAKVNAIVMENMQDFTKLCEASGQITQEYRDVMMKVVDFYIQLCPSRETYDMAANFKKVITDSLVMNKDVGNMFQDFIKNVSQNFVAKK